MRFLPVGVAHTPLVLQCSILVVVLPCTAAVSIGVGFVGVHARGVGVSSRCGMPVLPQGVVCWFCLRVWYACFALATRVQAIFWCLMCTMEPSNAKATLYASMTPRR